MYTKLEAPFVHPLPGPHAVLHQILLNPCSDAHNTPVQVLQYTPRLCDTPASASGKCFFIVSAIARRSAVIFIQAPDCIEPRVTLASDSYTVQANGCTVYAEECPKGQESAVLRTFLRTQMPLPLFAMVNNWGDRHGPEVLSESFCMNEIDAAAALGMDVVQLDDGWQKGSSKDARILDENGNSTFYRRFDGDFWTVDRVKFPNGLEKIARYALSKGITPGLWFAPDARGHFANLERDVQVLKTAVDIGFRYFKLDMVKIVDTEDRDRFVLFMEKAHALADDIYLQLDVTGKVPRLGFTDGLSFGKLFVENRYTRGGDYLPYLTLRNLWQLSRYIPAQHFQFEVPNRRMYQEDYATDDPLSPIHYSPAWQFASVMVSCPLFWMEIQHFDPADRAELLPLMQVWKQERSRLALCDVQPVGGLPDGTQLTGFLCTDEQGGYLVALSEHADENTLTVSLPGAARDIRCLHAVPGASCMADGSKLTVSLPGVLSYAFFRFSWA